MSARVAVIVPTYRRPEALARTLEALLRQEASEPVEVVVSDDGSPPPEAERVAAAVEAAAAGAAARDGEAGEPRFRLRLVRGSRA